MKIIGPILVGLLVVCLFAGCTKQNGKSQVESVLKDYNLEIEGTQGLQLDMLIITKSSKGTLERERTRIQVPFSKRFDALKCAVWLDAKGDGQEGNYRAILTTNGMTSSKIFGSLQLGNKSTGSIHDF